MRNNNVFDRSVAFTFYKEWKEDADTIEEDFGAEGKAKFYDAIINYALFEVEPEMKAPIKYFWNTIKEKIDASQKNRSKGFREDTGMTQKVIDYKQQNPEASVRDVAKAVGCSIGKVSKSLNSTPISTSTTITTPTSTTTNTTMNVNSVNSVNSVNTITDDIKLAIIDMFRARTNYSTIQAKIKTDFDTYISFDDIKLVIDSRNTLEPEIKHKKATAPTNQTEQADYERFGEIVDALANKGIKATIDDVTYCYRFSRDNKSKPWTIDEMVNFINTENKQSFYDYVNAI